MNQSIIPVTMFLLFERFLASRRVHKVAHSMYPAHQVDTSGCSPVCEAMQDLLRVPSNI